MLSSYVRLGLLLLCATTAPPAGQAATSSNVHNNKRADYTLDDSYWNEESPVGEVERLLRDYRQNQELVRNIGANYYQIIYPVQIRHHDKMGISTREVGSQKFPNIGPHGSNEGYSSGGSFRSKSRMGKHFHKTSILIKAFNHKFRLDLELNTELLAPNLVQKHFLPHGAEQVSKQEIEHCYYHGTVKDMPGATAAFHTCNGVAGVIHIGNETFIIHPFYGGDLSQKHPHVIFEARDKAKRGCANELRLDRKSKYASGFVGGRFRKKRRLKRDLRERTKYIETALILDKAMFEMRNGSTRSEVITDAIQIANIADLYFRTINTRVSVVYIETWQGANQAPIDKNQEISAALLNFNEYSSRELFNVAKDTAQLLSGEYFVGGETGMAIHGTVCTSKSVGISVDVNAYEPHIIAGSMAHMIGHNVGMGHDDKREECNCVDWHGCIMQQSIVGMENIQPYKFSDCSLNDYINEFRETRNMCLLNKPNEIANSQHKCGNNIVDEDEECDCGSYDNCRETDRCCDPTTCKLYKEAECSESGSCCNKECKLMSNGTLCREAISVCDLPEYCSGNSGECPDDMFVKNGKPCGKNHAAYCYMGQCPTLNEQCEQIWGYDGISSEKQCYEEFNTQGTMSGHCGILTDEMDIETYLKCDEKNVQCGSLQCQKGSRYPQSGLTHSHTETFITLHNKNYECKSTTGSKKYSLVQDGTRCGENMICINQTCTRLFVEIGKCPSNHNNLECSSHGICSNIDQCFCDSGWTGIDCSLKIEIYSSSPIDSGAQTLSPEDAKKAMSDLEKKMIMKETPYVNAHSTNTGVLVMILMTAVGVVFMIFTCSALCYRHVVVYKMNPCFCFRRGGEKPGTDKQKPSTSTTPISKPSRFDAPSEESVEEMPMVNMNRMTKYGNQSPYNRSETGSHKMLFHSNNHLSPSTSGISMEHKSHNLSRLGLCSNDEDDNVQDALHMDGRGSSCGIPPGSVSISDMERKIKSLDGYHGDLLEKLRTAAHRSGARSSSEDLLWRTLTETAESAYNRIAASQERLGEDRHGLPQSHTVLSESGAPACHRHPYRRSSRRSEIGPEDDDDTNKEMTSSTIRIRNLEDLFKQIQEHTVRHSPSGSDDNRMSEPEVDRHFRHDSHNGCEEPRFVRGWYRPASRATSGSASPYLQSAARMATAATVHATTAHRPIARSASLDMPVAADDGVQQSATVAKAAMRTCNSARSSQRTHCSPSSARRQRRNDTANCNKDTTCAATTAITGIAAITANGLSTLLNNQFPEYNH
ncbi:disintegrin and metalloproteinase domain-containing protein unc-71 isoform X3 [Daktulosphaira vitifoliae]|uniref:disintegrin and metalloproteinase domain-containing protein unc-71 isoform X3 n=1 Tax=Daktulosphaira vitifoliae TaxID=58002 RepID=UPI0021AA9D69|nr:disintegrin and metalloproteinase domain-containing protein unc-71 isoform X3 [Daktulosphaira vitifoliae]